MTDNARQTGAALESYYEYLIWLLQKTAKFSKSHKFTLGDRITATALDVLESLIAATYTRNRLSHLQNANLGLEKLRFLIRVAHDIGVLDRNAYEFSARSLNETGRLIGGWIKTHNAANPD